MGGAGLARGSVPSAALMSPEGRNTKVSAAPWDHWSGLPSFQNPKSSGNWTKPEYKQAEWELCLLPCSLDRHGAADLSSSLQTTCHWALVVV